MIYQLYVSQIILLVIKLKSEPFQKIRTINQMRMDLALGRVNPYKNLEMKKILSKAEIEESQNGKSI